MPETEESLDSSLTQGERFRPAAPKRTCEGGYCCFHYGKRQEAPIPLRRGFDAEVLADRLGHHRESVDACRHRVDLFPNNRQVRVHVLRVRNHHLMQGSQDLRLLVHMNTDETDIRLERGWNGRRTSPRGR